MPVSAQKSRVLVGDFHLSSYATSIGGTWQQDMLDTTVLTDTSKTSIIGSETSTAKVSGLFDDAQHADAASWKSAAAQPITVGLNGLALGSELWMVNGLLTEMSTNAARNGVVGFDLNAQTDGLTDFGVSLHDLTAVTADESGTGYDGAAATTGGGVAHLHATAYSGLASAVIIVEDSANNSVWATIGTFATLTAVGRERLAIAGTIRRYVRYSIDVTGTGSITFAVGLARR